MITLNSTYSLIAKMGEALTTTQPDYVIFYGKPFVRREAGTATEVRSYEVGRGSMNSTTNVTLLAATTVGGNDKYVVDSITICNRDTVAHTVHISIYDGTTETRLFNAVAVPINSTLRIDEDGMTVLPEVMTTSSVAAASSRVLSGSTNGKGILVVQTATAGTLLHTATTGTVTNDRVRLWVVNSDTTARKLTIEFGGVTVPDHLIEMTVPAEDGLFEVTPSSGLLINNGLLIRAFAATANVLVIYGEVETE